MSFYAMFFEGKELCPVFDFPAAVLERGIKSFFPVGAGGVMVMVAGDEDLRLGYGVKIMFGCFELGGEARAAQIPPDKDKVDVQRPEEFRQIGEGLVVTLFFAKKEPIERPCQPFHAHFEWVEVDAGKMNVGNLYDSHILHERV